MVEIYKQIHAMVTVSHKLINEGLQPLAVLGASDIAKEGCRSLYTLHGIERSRSYCMLPQSHLQNGQA